MEVLELPVTGGNISEPLPGLRHSKIGLKVIASGLGQENSS